MKENSSDLQYVTNALKKAESQNAGSPAIWCLWGIIVLVGYAVVEFVVQYSMIYWIAASVAGGLASWWLGERFERQHGQIDIELGKQFAGHFFIQLVFIFTAVFTGKYMEILLLFGLGYALAGIYLDKLFLPIAALSWLLYLGAHAGLVSSWFIIGIVLSAGLFAMGWITHRKNSRSSS